MVTHSTGAGRALGLGLLLALAASPARGGWTAATVPGTPKSVQITGRGTFSVATSRGAFFFRDGTTLEGSFREAASANIVGALLSPASGCMCAVDGPGGVLTSNCSAQSAQLGSGVLGLKHAFPTGAGYLLRELGGAGFLSYYAAGATPDALPADVFVPIGLDLPLGPMDVESVPPATMAVYQVQSGGSSNSVLRFVSEKTLVGDLLVVAGTGPTRSVALVSTPSSLHAFVGADRGLFRIDSSDGAATWSAVQQPFATQTGESVLSVSLDGRAGLAGARGHGAMVVSGGTADRHLRAVPAFPSQGAPGARWIETTTGLSSSVPLAGIECMGGHTCVAYRSMDGGTNLAIYTNDAAPVMTPGPVPAAVPEGAPLSLSLAGVSDADGDPVGLQWSVTTAVGAPPVHTQSGDGLTLSVDTHDLSVCEPSRTFSARTEASDGLAANQRMIIQTFDVLRSRSPKISPASGTLTLGGPSVPLTAQPDDFAICDPSAWRWSVSGPGSLSTQLGAQTTLTSTGAVCDPAGGVVSVQVEATAPSGNVTSPAATFQVPAWGPSPAPFSSTPVHQQPAGTRQRYGAAAHACGATPGFPGQETRWRLISPPLAGVRLVDDAEQPMGSEGTSAGLTVEAGACAIGALDFEVESALVGGTWPATGSSLRVQVVQPVISIADATLAVAVTDASAGLLRGTLSTNIPCPSAEGWLASLEVFEGGASLGPPIDVSPDAAFELPLPQLCSGGAFTLVATLKSPQGAPGMQVTVPVTGVQTPARVGALMPPLILAGCDEGARGPLTLMPPADACLGATWTWTRKSGPPLVSDVLTGRTVEVVSAPGTPLEDLVGRTLRFEVRADAGRGNVEVKDVEVLIGAQVLVDVEATTETALIPMDGYSGARVAFHNVTGCALHTLQLHVPLSGLTLAPGPVALDGRAATASFGDGGLTIDDVALSSNASTSLELLVRPSLSGKPSSLQAEVLLNGVRISAPISASEPVDSTEGCGCAGGGLSPAAALLVGLLGLLRRRARR